MIILEYRERLYKLNNLSIYNNEDYDKNCREIL